MGQLDGQHALITGGTSGIGLASARRLAAEGAHVVITGRREQSDINAIAANVGPAATGFRSDASDLGDIATLMATLRDQGVRLDVLLVAAGGGEFSSLADTTPEHFADAFDRNVRGVLFTVQGALPLLNDGASIVLIGSTAAFSGTPSFGAYAASKAALRSFGRTWAAELVERKIRVNVLTPGPTATPGLDGLVPAEATAGLHQQLASGVPLGRLADPDEIARAALFLATDASSFMTGAELVVDGGQTQI